MTRRLTIFYRFSVSIKSTFYDANMTIMSRIKPLQNKNKRSTYLPLSSRQIHRAQESHFVLLYIYFIYFTFLQKDKILNYILSRDKRSDNLIKIKLDSSQARRQSRAWSCSCYCNSTVDKQTGPDQSQVDIGGRSYEEHLLRKLQSCWVYQTRMHLGLYNRLRLILLLRCAFLMLLNKQLSVHRTLPRSRLERIRSSY